MRPLPCPLLQLLLVSLLLLTKPSLAGSNITDQIQLDFLSQLLDIFEASPDTRSVGDYANWSRATIAQACFWDARPTIVERWIDCDATTADPEAPDPKITSMSAMI